MIRYYGRFYGASDPLQELAVLREEAGEHELAERLAREAYSAGDTSALLDLALLREANDREGAERLAREATVGGHPYALQTLARARAGGQRQGRCLPVDVGGHPGRRTRRTARPDGRPD